ncbi:MAG: serine/threonine-protein kinase [Polyangiaceae bacterium]
MRVCSACLEVYDESAAFCPSDGTMLRSEEDPMLGKTIASRFRLLKRLGSGATSIVYLARHVVIDRLSAIKVLRREFEREVSYRERFLREARAVNRIAHPNIVEISDVGESDGFAYLVMEYVPGISLLDHMQQGKFPWQRAVRVAVQIAAALARAHEARVIHRDLKPENILLVPTEEGDERVKLTDFGIAKLLDLPSVTISDQIFGTPGYIAPEYIKGEPGDARSDLYALGVVLYEMIVGDLPFAAKGQAEMLLKPLSSTAVPPSARTPGLPVELEGLMLRLIARSPDDRPQDAEMVVVALNRIIEADEAREREEEAPNTPAVRITGDTIIEEPAETRRRGSDLTPVEGIEHAAAAAPAPFFESRQSMRPSMIPRPSMLPPQALAAAAERWADTATHLEESIDRAEARGAITAADAARARELSRMARAMMPRVQRTSELVHGLQAELDALEKRGREMKQNFGRAVDTLLHDRARHRIAWDSLRAKRDIADVKRPLAPLTDNSLWAAASSAVEDEHARAIDTDLSFQIETLQRELDRNNDEHDRELLDVTGRLEGAIGALRLLTQELASSLDAAARITASKREPDVRPVV